MTEGKGEVRELPKGWASTTVKETIKIIDYRGRTPPYSEHGIPHLRSSNIRDRKIVWENLRYVSEETYQAYMTRGLPEKGDVLFTTEAPLGEVALAPEKRFSLAQRMMILRPNKNLLSSKFLLYQIENEEFQRNLSKSGTGTTVTGVSSRNFQPTPIILAPTNEQNRIVEKIEELFSELDQGIESLKTAQKQLKVYRQAVLKWAFEGKLTEEWRKRQSTLKTGEALLAQIKTERENHYQQQLAEWETAVKEWEAIGKPGKKPTKPQKHKEPALLAEAELVEIPKLPESWCWTGLEYLKEFSIYGPRFSSQDYSNDGVFVLRTSDISEFGKVDLKKAPKLPLTEEEYEKYKLIKNDLLITRTGSIGTISVFNDTAKAIPGAFLIHYRLLSPSNIWFIFHFLKSFKSQQYFKGKSAGVGRPNLNVPSIEELRIPFPSLEEQEQVIEEIESRLSICDQLETTIIENLQKAEALRQSILKQAFEGKLVPQDSNDEPAEQLLERIKAERQVNGNTDKKSKPFH